MQNNHKYVKILSLEFVLSIGLALFLLSAIQVSAQPLSKDPLTGNVTEVDITIEPGELLPANGTVTISTEGATDTDMDGFPPEGVYVIISSDSVTVTNQPVDIGTADVEEDESGSENGSDGDESGSENGSDGDESGSENGSDGDGAEDDE
jgi:hypothetical protein